MKSLTLSLLIGFIAVSVWGLSVMRHEGSYTADGCIASAVDKVACPLGALTTAEHHMSAYQTFFQVLPLFPVISFLFVISIFFIGFVFLKNFVFTSLFAHTLQFIRHRKRNPSVSLHQSRNVTAWLSLFELSPAF